MRFSHARYVTLLVFVMLVGRISRTLYETTAFMGQHKYIVMTSSVASLPTSKVPNVEVGAAPLRSIDSTNIIDVTEIPSNSDSNIHSVQSQEPEFLVKAFLAKAALQRKASRPGPRSACFVALVRHTQEGVQRLYRLLRNIREVLPLMAEQYPFVAFVEPGAQLGPIPSDVYPSGVIVAQLTSSTFGKIPNFIKPEHTGAWSYPSRSWWGVSYRHMCRFFGVKVMYEKALEGFQYYMRLDTDSYLLSTPRNALGEELDLFHEMAHRKAKYGFVMLHPQTLPQFLRDLWEAYDDFSGKELREGSGQDPFGAPRALGLHYWDNFEIVELAMFRSADKRAIQMRNFLDFMDRRGGFYYHRWGDAEMRTLLVTKFLQPHERVYFTSLGYQHYHNYHCPPERAMTPPPGGITDNISLAMAYIREMGEQKADPSRVISFIWDRDALVRGWHKSQSERQRCLKEAAQDYGEGKKGRGSAHMDPAEHSHNSDLYWRSAKEEWIV